VTLDDTGGSPLADRADEIGGTLARVFEAGARSIAIDLLLHAKWADSPAFSDLVVRHSESLTLAAFSEPDGRVSGTECVAGLTAAALGPERAAGLFGFVNLDEDPDGVVRQGRTEYRDRSGRTRPSWAAKAAASLNTAAGRPHSDAAFLLDPRIDWTRYTRISWREIPALLDRTPGYFRDRLVLVGAGVRASGDDYHRVPYRLTGDAAVSGLTLQALLVDTIAAGLPARELDGAPIRAAAALLTGLAMAGILCGRRPALFVRRLAAATAAYLTLSFVVFGWTGWMLPVSSLLLLVLLGLSVALAIRRMLPPAPEVST
jgi:CHASE2 domain-containing sensor protein